MSAPEQILFWIHSGRNPWTTVANTNVNSLRTLTPAFFLAQESLDPILAHVGKRMPDTEQQLSIEPGESNVV